MGRGRKRKEGKGKKKEENDIYKNIYTKSYKN